MGLKDFYKNELFRASLVLLILINISNVLNYVFHFVMGRMLGPADYGVLAVLASIIYIFSVPTTSIQTLVSKYTTRLNVKKEHGKIKGMLKFMILEAALIAAVIFVVFCASSIFLSGYLKISFWLLCLTGLYLFGAFTSPVGLGVLQGMKKFSAWGWNSILNSIVKIVIAVILVILGFGVYGPVLGFIFSILISFIFIFPYIKEIMSSKEVKEKVGILSRSNFSLLASIMIITLMYSLDIIFAKVLFSPEVAGQYSVVSMIGKMIFFGTASISNAMFPISSERFFKENREKTKSIVKKAFLIILGLCVIAIALIGFFPSFIVGLLFGSQYLSVSGILLYMGIAFSFIALTNTFVLYKLSVEDFRIRYAGILGIFLVVQIIFFAIFNANLQAFAIAFMYSTIITFLGSILLMRRWKWQEKRSA